MQIKSLIIIKIVLFLLFFTPLLSYATFYDDSSKLSLENKTIIIYNENSLDAYDIAVYYANARGISHNRLCPVKSPTGQFISTDQLLGIRNTLVEDCICDSIEEFTGSKPNPCDISNIEEITNKSSINHIVIIKGIPPRLTGVSYDTVSQEPSSDYYLSRLIYENIDYFSEGKTGRVNQSFYEGNYDNLLDYQPSRSDVSYVRGINVSLDKIVAYGRIEAMDKNRTLDLIDRTMLAEIKGIEGNILYSGDELLSSLRMAPQFLRFLTDELNDDCFSYLSNLYPNNAWPYVSCRFGINAKGRIPGEYGTINTLGGNIQRAINVGAFYGYHHGEVGSTGNMINSHNAFDGFDNMLDWHKSEYDCTTLCSNFADPNDRQNCVDNSFDYFKNLNSNCVGVADGFIGWQFRSWPVQYYGFWPAGWTVTSADGAVPKTPPIVIRGNSYVDENFTDEFYLRYGALDSAPIPNCILGNGSVAVCNEHIAVNLRQVLSSQDIPIVGSNKFTIKFRYKNPKEGARLYPRLYLDYQVATDTYLSGTIILSDSSEWTLAELNLTTMQDGDVILNMYLDILSDFGINSPKSYLELDAFEVIDVTNGRVLSDKSKSTFNITNNLQTIYGDYAANVIDRLGGIAWWGSSSHYLSGGGAFYHLDKFVGAFYSGKTLGESLAYTGNKATSGIIYGDPLYRPSGVKLYVGDGYTYLNDFSGITYSSSDISNLKFKINSFQGMSGTSSWKLFACSDQYINCDYSDWNEVKSGYGITFEQEFSENILSMLPNPYSNHRVTFKLSVNNEIDPNYTLNSFSHIIYLADSCVDVDGDGYGIGNCGFFTDCNDNNPMETKDCLVCTPTLVNTTWSSWTNVGNCLSNNSKLQSRNLTEYDINYCGEIANQTYFESQYAYCDFCTPNLNFTDWSIWENSVCYDDQMNQSSFRIEFDSNYCFFITGLESDNFVNITHYDYQLIGPDFINTTWSDWIDFGVCNFDDLQLQIRNLTQYDEFGCANNITFYDYRNVSCDSCTPTLVNTTWSDWTNIGNCLSNNSKLQSRNLTEYDINYCGEIANQTYFESQYVYCDFDLEAPLTSLNYIYSGWNKNNVSINLSCFDNNNCDKTYYCFDLNNTCNPWSGNVFVSNFYYDSLGKHYLRFSSNDSYGNIENTKSFLIKIFENTPVVNYTNFDIILSTNINELVSYNNISNFSLGKKGQGKIKFLENIDLINFDGVFNNVILDDFINISQRFISVDSKLFPELNVSAELTFFEVQFKTPKLKKNGLEFTNYTVVQNPSYNNNYSFIFIVDSFSSYEVYEGYVSSVDLPSRSGTGGSSFTKGTPINIFPVSNLWESYTLNKDLKNYFNKSNILSRIIVLNFNSTILNFYLDNISNSYFANIGSNLEIDLNFDGVPDANLIYENMIDSSSFLINIRELIFENTNSLEEILFFINESKVVLKEEFPSTIHENLSEKKDDIFLNNNFGSYAILSFIFIIFFGFILFYYKFHSKKHLFKRIGKSHNMHESQIIILYDWLCQCQMKGLLDAGFNALKEKGWKVSLVNDLEKLFK